VQCPSCRIVMAARDTCMKCGGPVAEWTARTPRDERHGPPRPFDEPLVISVIGAVLGGATGLLISGATGLVVGAAIGFLLTSFALSGALG